MSMYIAKGFTFKVGETSVGHITSIGGVEITTDEEETTAVTDNSGYRSYMPTYRDGNSVDLEGIYDSEDGGFDALSALKESDELTAFEIIFPAAMQKKWTFNGYLSSFKFGEATVGNLIKWTATIRVSGAPTLATTT